MWRIYNPKFTNIHLAISQLGPYKVLPFNKVIWHARIVFFIPPFKTVGGLYEPLLYLHTYACLPNNSLISAWVSIKFPMYVLPVNQLSAKSKLWNAFKRSFYTVYSHNMHSKQMICINF